MKKLSKNNPSVANATAPFTQGSLRSRSLRGMGFARSLCNTKAKLAIKRTINKNFEKRRLLYEIKMERCALDV